MTFLHHVGNLIRDLLSAVPLAGVRVLFLGTFVLLLVWVWRLPREVVTPPGGARRWDENLRVGATLALLIQLAVYWWL